MVEEGYYFGLPPLLLGLGALATGTRIGSFAGVPLALLALLVFYFFRDPERHVPADLGLIVSPADGKVVVVTNEERGGHPGKRVSIFLAIWNVHVNRSPAAGTVKNLEYRPGKFMAAWNPTASTDNEQNIFTLVTEHGEIVFKQIAGYVARRVVSWKKSGESVARGERVGLVRFGSRVDVWLPETAELAVRVGDHVKGGSSILGRVPIPSANTGVPAFHPPAEVVRN